MNTNGHQPEAAPAAATIEVDDLHTFVHHLAGWHGQKVRELKHMQEVPDGTTMEVNGVDVIFTGDLLAGFKAGVELALMQLGTLPFTAELEEASVQ